MKIKKRLMVTVAMAIVVPLMVKKLGVDEATAQQIVYGVIAYLMGQTATDMVAIHKGNKEQ